jgi:iron(III) transport system permease protein
MTRASFGQYLLAVVIAIFLVATLIVPVAAVVKSAFTNADGSPTLGHMASLFQVTLLRESFYNSLYVAVLTVLAASILALPLAYLTSRFQFRGAAVVSSLAVLPLVMPPFIGAVAMQLFFGKNGAVNLLLREYLGFRIPIMEGLTGVIFVESLHYFPFILLNVAAALANLDGAMEEAAENLGCTGIRLFRRIVLPLVLPGYLAGALLVFIKVFDDLGTPLVLGITNMLAPQAYLRITSVGVDDPLGYVICVALVGISLASLWLANRALAGRDYSTSQRGGTAVSKYPLRSWRAVLAYAWVAFVLLLVLSPLIGLLLLSFAKVWSYSVLPDAFTSANYLAMIRDSPRLVWNTLLYCGVAAGVDVLIGTAVAYLMLRTSVRGGKALDFLASASLAVPGIVLGIGYLRIFRGVNVPFTETAVLSTWLAITTALTVRRLPYALRSCVAALQQVHPSLEEAALNLGATRRRAVVRIVMPLMLGGIVAGFITVFVTAAVELSTTLVLLASSQQAPLALGIYFYLQSMTGRGPGAALAVVAVVLVGLGTFASQRLMKGRGALREV